MSNSMKSIVFIISLIAFYILSTLISPVLTTLFGGASTETLPSIISTVYILGFLGMLYTQALIRYLYTKKYLNNANILITAPVRPYRVFDRLFIYALPTAAAVIPILNNKSFTSDSLKSFMFIAIFIVIVEILFYISNKTMKVYITDSGIAVTGVDIRLELPFSLNYPCGSGFYSFERIDNFLMTNDAVLLYNSYDSGIITIKIGTEGLRQIKGLLLAKKIPERRF